MAANTTEWQDLAAPGGFATCVHESCPEVYGYVALLTGHDRDAAEDLVRSLYSALEREVRTGGLDRVSLGRLRTAARRLWVQRHAARAAAAAPGVADAPRVPTLADLSEAERAVAVFRYVNRMPSTAVAEEIGLDVRMVDALDARALRRLGAVGGSTRLREHWGDVVHPRDGFVDELAPPEPEPEPEPEPGSLDDAVVALDADDDAVDVDGVAGAAEPVDDADDDEADDDDADDDDADDDDADDDDADDVDVADADDGAAPVEHDHETGELDAVVVAPVAPVPPAAAPPEPAPARRRSRGHTAVVGMTVLLAVGAVVAAGVLWFGSRDDGGSAATSSTVASTVAATSPSTTPTSTEAPRPLVGFDPVCVEREPSTTAEPAVDSAVLETFGPLGPTPALTVDLPDSVSGGAIGTAAASVVRVAGGVVATVTADPAAPFDGAIVARIDADGTVRWVRCLETAAVVRSVSGVEPADALAIGIAGAWTELSLADGTQGAALAAEPPAAATTPYGDPGTTATWPDPALSTIPTEAFTAATTGTVTVVLGCLVAPTATGCDQPVLRGYDSATVTLLWERVGVSDVAAIRNGFAVIRYAAPGAEPAWYMINAADGTAVDAQVWPAASFSGNVATLHGGVLADVVDGVLSLWYPAAAGAPSSTVALP